MSLLKLPPLFDPRVHLREPAQRIKEERSGITKGETECLDFELREFFIKFTRVFFLGGVYLRSDTGAIIGDCVRGGFRLLSAMLIANLLCPSDLKEGSCMKSKRSVGKTKSSSSPVNFVRLLFPATILPHVKEKDDR